MCRLSCLKIIAQMRRCCVVVLVLLTADGFLMQTTPISIYGMDSTKATTCTVNITNFLGYSFKGELIHAAVNYPGTCHDSRLASLSRLVFSRLDDAITSPRFALLVDFALITRNIKEKIRQSRINTETFNISQSKALAAVGFLMQRVMPSNQQSAEWGVRAIKHLLRFFVFC